MKKAIKKIKVQKRDRVMEVLHERTNILGRQQIADGLIEFIRKHDWNYMPVGRKVLKDEIYHRNNICACAIDQSIVPELARPSITPEQMEEYEGEYISALVGVQLGLYRILDEYVDAIDQIEQECNT